MGISKASLTNSQVYNYSSLLCFSSHNFLLVPGIFHDSTMAPALNATPAQALALLPKLSDADADLRYMSLNDLCNVLNSGAPGFLTADYHTCAKIIDGVLLTLDDQNGEVQNQAIKWQVSVPPMAAPEA